jgi:hypothetical protein
MERKKIIRMSLESPLYFTMSLKSRLEFVKRCEKVSTANGLREKLLTWVQTGQYNSANSNSHP